VILLKLIDLDCTLQGNNHHDHTSIEIKLIDMPVFPRRRMTARRSCPVPTLTQSWAWCRHAPPTSLQSGSTRSPKYSTTSPRSKKKVSATGFIDMCLCVWVFVVVCFVFVYVCVCVHVCMCVCVCVFREWFYCKYGFLLFFTCSEGVVSVAWQTSTPTDHGRQCGRGTRHWNTDTADHTGKNIVFIFFIGPKWPSWGWNLLPFDY
jgi:hypothetical protein